MAKPRAACALAGPKRGPRHHSEAHPALKGRTSVVLRCPIEERDGAEGYVISLPENRRLYEKDGLYSWFRSE